MAKIIVTHFNPDLDALCCIWLIRKFWPIVKKDVSWADAEVKFVGAGKTLNDEPVDSNPDIVHVDTGLGKFDHHQDAKLAPACSLVFKDLETESEKIENNEALARLVDVVVDADRGNYIHWSESQTDRYEFSLNSIIDGLKKQSNFTDPELVDFGMTAFEGVYLGLRIKIQAEKTLEEGIQFSTKWGDALAFEVENDAVLEAGEKKGFSIVIRKDPRKGWVRIYARNDRGVDLTPVYEELKKSDPEATWFLHQSKCLLLNGSSKNPGMKPTKLSLDQVMKIFKNI
ncbi:hypothetical protein HY439_01755 [Candidatus Microgenomates bacterium]|nr:hypothetical protein [Candidatus Microgenomates bacterium]